MYDTIKEYSFVTRQVEVEAVDISEEDPEIDRIKLLCPDIESGYISLKPRKEIDTEKTVNGIDVSGSSYVPYRSSEIPQKYQDLIRLVQTKGAEIKATVTLRDNRQDDSTDDNTVYYFITRQNLDSIKAYPAPRPETETKVDLRTQKTWKARTSRTSSLARVATLNKNYKIYNPEAFEDQYGEEMASAVEDGLNSMAFVGLSVSHMAETDQPLKSAPMTLHVGVEGLDDIEGLSEQDNRYFRVTLQEVTREEAGL